MATAPAGLRRPPSAPASGRRAAPARASARSRTQREPPDPAEIIEKLQGLKKQPWEVDVDVYLRPSNSVPPFTLETCLHTTSSGRIMFRNRRRPGFIIRFRLHNELDPGYRFPSDPTEAVWSQRGGACPDQYGIWDVLEPFAVEGAGMSLLVYNENGDPAIGNFQYNLRVTNGSAWRNLDPGGGDQNGPSD